MTCSSKKNLLQNDIHNWYLNQGTKDRVRLKKSKIKITRSTPLLSDDSRTISFYINSPMQ